MAQPASRAMSSGWSRQRRGSKVDAEGTGEKSGNVPAPERAPAAADAQGRQGGGHDGYSGAGCPASSGSIGSTRSSEPRWTTER